MALANRLSSQTSAPGKEVAVALDWTLDLFFTKDFVQYLHERSPAIDDILTAHASGAVSEVFPVRSELNQDEKTDLPSGLSATPRHKNVNCCEHGK